ncbi:protein FAM32A-like [Rhopilema esculentum]|uniref:protein FAM32A-like n=1 Tax=Rhopilema esculentum TaxID=499914 RepID=UPI0031E06BCB
MVSLYAVADKKMADDVYKSTVVGGLKLKGVKPSGIKKKKKKKNKAKEIESYASKGSPKQSEKNEENNEVEEQGSTKTPAEIAFEKAQQTRATERIMKKAAKTHKQRVEELNSYLDGLSEHYDIQKVSWTK